MAPPGRTSRNPAHRQLRRQGSAGVAILLCLLAASPATAGPLFLVPGIDAAAGATSNRFLAPRAQGSPFLQLTPALEALWFGADGREVGGSIEHRTTRYTRPGFERRDETTVAATLWQLLPAAELSAAARAGVYRDRAVPTDDNSWWEGSLVLRALPEGRLVPGLGARVAGTRFRTRATRDGRTRRDLGWRLEPELRWQGAHGLTPWVGASAERLSSNAPESRYRGFGLAGGLDAQPGDTFGAGLWARWRRLRYDDRSRDSTSAGAGAWANLRLTAWAELTADAHYLDHPGRDPLDEYREWGVEAGVRLRYDWPLIR